MPSNETPLPQTLEEAHELIRTLLARIEELERRLNLNSQNSSKPPSSDPPHAKAPRRERRGRGKRKPGGQPGHKGHHRELLPVEQVDEFIDHWPSACDHCHATLPEDGRVDAAEPGRHQVSELPEVTIRVTEHRLHAQACSRCGCTTTGQLPADVPRGVFGPRLTAAVAVLTGCYRMGKRMAKEAIEDLFGGRISLGSVAACEQIASRAVADPVEEAREYVRSQPAAGADETSWHERRRKAWLWVMSTPLVVVFMIHAQRGKTAARALLKSFAGTLLTDRWSAYRVHDGRRQACWAHLDRDFEGMSERKGQAGRIGKELVQLVDKMFRWWRAVRDGRMKRTTFRRKMRPLRERVEDLLTEGVESAIPQVSGMCWDILGVHGDALWTFVDVEGVEPTNNQSERPLRHAVMWRKTSWGTHSEAGSRFVERMLTVRATLRAQERNVVSYVTQALEASLRGQHAPSLLPQDPAALPALAA